MKAQSNWEEKSQYLLREIVKYDLYIDSLQIAMALRLKKRGEKGRVNHSFFILFLIKSVLSFGACPQWIRCNRRNDRCKEVVGPGGG